MPAFILIAVGTFLLLIFFPRIRGAIFHLRVRQFVFIFIGVSFAAAAAAFGFVAWKIFLPAYMTRPTVEWTDTTIDLTIDP